MIPRLYCPQIFKRFHMLYSRVSRLAIFSQGQEDLQIRPWRCSFFLVCVFFPINFLFWLLIFLYVWDSFFLSCWGRGLTYLSYCRPLLWRRFWQIIFWLRINRVAMVYLALLANFVFLFSLIPNLFGSGCVRDSAYPEAVLNLCN